MTEVKLLSIKIKKEHAYFFENDGATFDSNSNKVVFDDKPNKNDERMSKKAQKAAEKEQKKQEKKELKQRKKESRKSAKLKSPQAKDENHEIHFDKTREENGEVVNLPQFSNPVFQDGTLEKSIEGNLQENASLSGPKTSGHNEQPETSGQNVELEMSHKNVEPETSCKNVEHEMSHENVEPETSGENVEPEMSHRNVEPEASGQNVELETGHQNVEPGSSGLVAHAKEEAVTCENADQAQEEPRELSWQSKPNPHITSPEQGQYVEVEISEVIELEDMPDSNEMTSESEIQVAIIQEAESGKELDSLFVEVYGQPGEDPSREKRKSVRFEEDSEPIEQNPDNMTDDIDGRTDADGEAIVTEVKHDEPPVDEIVGNDHFSNGENREIDLDEIFESCVKDVPNTTEDENHRIEIASDDVTPNGKPSGGHEELVREKEKRKKGGLLKCCFS